MSPICQLQMTLAGGFPGVSGMTVRLMSDRELTRLEALRDVDQKRLGGGAAAGARAPSGVPVIEGVSDRRRDGFDRIASRAVRSRNVAILRLVSSYLGSTINGSNVAHRSGPTLAKFSLLFRLLRQNR
jgi:hypothetical protein